MEIEISRDSSGDDYIDVFNVMLKFATFNTTVQEIVEEEVLFNNKKDGI